MKSRAFPNETRIEKCNSKSGDTHTDGAGGTIVSHLAAGEYLAYCIHWDDLPGIPVWIAASRVKLPEQPQ